MALEITDATFEEVVLKSDKPVLVDFWAAWCGPCRMVGPVIDQISEEYQGKAVIGKVDVDAHQEFAAKYGVRNIPTVLVFQNGEVVGRQVGVAPKIPTLKHWTLCCKNSLYDNLKRFGSLPNLFIFIDLPNYLLTHEPSTRTS